MPVSKDNRPIAFCNKKLNPAHVNYTTTERELLSIIETLKELRYMQIKVCTNHKNLTYKSFNTERVMGWRLFLEEFSLKLNVIEKYKSVVADVPCLLDKIYNLNNTNSNNN